MSASTKSQLKPTNASKPWSVNEEVELSTMLLKDPPMKMKDIALVLERGKMQVANHARKLAMKLRVENKYSDEEIKKMMGYDLSRVKQKKVQTKKPTASTGKLSVLSDQLNAAMAKLASVASSLRTLSGQKGKKTQRKTKKPSPKKTA